MYIFFFYFFYSHSVIIFTCQRLRSSMPHNYSLRHYYLKHAHQPYVGGEPLPRCNSLAGHVRHGLARLTTPDVEPIPTNMLGWRLLSAKVW